MNRLRGLLMRFGGLFSRERRDRELAAELECHLEIHIADNLRAGMTPKEARRQALLKLGGVEQTKESYRQRRGLPSFERFVRNVRFGLRMLWRNPGFSTVAILTLALGIGANSAVFSAIDAILLRPLPFPNGDELMQISQYDPKIKTMQSFVAPVRLEDWKRMNSTFQELSGYYLEDLSEVSGSLPEKLTQALVAPRFLRVWGIAPALGRDFNPAEEHFGGPNAALISDALWHRRFGASPDVLGKKLRFDKWSYTIVGVMPASFAFPVEGVDFWSPSPTDAPYAQSRDATWFTVIGRLRPGVTVEQARSNLATVQAQLGKQYPKTDADLTVGIQPLKETIIGGVRSSFWLLFGSVTLLLLIACANVAALILARATQRQHEMSIRYSLGASAGAMVWQSLTEVFLIALAGSAAGLLVAGAAAKAFRTLAANLPRVEEIHLDARIVLYSLACSVVATLLCGLFPAFRTAHSSIWSSLAESSGTQVSTRNRTQWLLVGVQVALAVVLLTGAGLLLRSFQALGHVSPGFEPSHVLTFHISAAWGETTDMKVLTQRIDRILDGLTAVPGVEAAATSSVLPGTPQKFQTEVRFLEGPSDPNLRIVSEGRWVSPRYFAVTKIPLLAGQLCQEQLNGLDVLVNRSFADTYLSGSAVVGRHIQLLGQDLPAGHIRGIVGDAREAGLDHEPVPTMYWCLSAPTPDPFYLVRTQGPPAGMANAIRERIHQLEPSRSMFDVLPLQQHLDAAYSENRLRMILLDFFAATALSLACIGLYGTISYSVAVRQREIALRLALGATRHEIAARFLFHGLAVSCLGCVAGIGLAAALARSLSGMLYGVSPGDPLTLSAIVFAALLVTVVASLAPAIRASRVDPMVALRYE